MGIVSWIILGLIAPAACGIPHDRFAAKFPSPQGRGGVDRRRPAASGGALSRPQGAASRIERNTHHANDRLFQPGRPLRSGRHPRNPRRSRPRSSSCPSRTAPGSSRITAFSPASTKSARPGRAPRRMAAPTSSSPSPIRASRSRCSATSTRTRAVPPSSGPRRHFPPPLRRPRTHPGLRIADARHPVNGGGDRQPPPIDAPPTRQKGKGAAPGHVPCAPPWASRLPVAAIEREEGERSH